MSFSNLHIKAQVFKYPWVGPARLRSCTRHCLWPLPRCVVTSHLQGWAPSRLLPLKLMLYLSPVGQQKPLPNGPCPFHKSLSLSEPAPASWYNTVFQAHLSLTLPQSQPLLQEPWLLGAEPLQRSPDLSVHVLLPLGVKGSRPSQGTGLDTHYAPAHLSIRTCTTILFLIYVECKPWVHATVFHFIQHTGFMPAFPFPVSSSEKPGFLYCYRVVTV